ncbi:MAG: hypothetical protein N2515_10550, partial [Deltaproteobacteria bacterium]|nr:hypothetical protein [Deltaproteobacteria bacterium]
MSSTGDFQRVYSQLVELFLMPLLQGGEVKIPPLLAPSCFELLEAFAKPITEADLRVARLLHIQALNLLPLKSIPWPSPSLIACAATLSHLAYLLDPLLSKPWYQRAFARAYGWAYEWVDHLPPPESVGEAVVRHLLLQSFRALRRRDITINTWIATYHFWGRPVPWNVTALPKLRRVRFTLNEERSLAEIIRLKSQEVKNIPGFTSLYEQAFARISPLDTLLNPTPALELDENKAQWLSDRFLRMAICNAFLQLDTSSLLELLGKITINATSYPHPH